MSEDWRNWAITFARIIRKKAVQTIEQEIQPPQRVCVGVGFDVELVAEMLIEEWQRRERFLQHMRGEGAGASLDVMVKQLGAGFATVKPIASGR